ncbi:MAG: hypothetical protein K2Z81_24420, partial [Cyanobacteria bacterium]|nr:hypothetical protein [Cyanobacteriota bacterium]
MVELVNDSFEYSKVTPSYISAVDIFSFSSAPANTSTKSDESMVSDQLVFTSLPGFDPPQTPGSTGPLLDDSNKSKEAIDNPTASSKEAAQPSYGSINDCLDGLNHKNFKEREKAQASLATFMYENVDNFKAVADTIEKNGSNLSEEQRDRWSKLLQHPFVGRLAVKGLAHDPAPVSVQDLESFVSNPEKLAKRIDL